MSFTLPLSPCTRKQLYVRLQQAYAGGALRLVRRMPALLALAQGRDVHEVAARWARGLQTVRDYRNDFLVCGMASLVSKRSPGRPSKLTKTQRQPFAEWIEAGPQAAGYTAACWSTPMIPDRMYRRFGVSSPPHSLATVLRTLGFSYQTARFVSDHLKVAKRLAWCQTEWPRMLRQARRRKALLLFGDAASFAPWGSWRYPWASTGQPPTVPTSGKRTGYTVFGRIAYCSG